MKTIVAFLSFVAALLVSAVVALKANPIAGALAGFCVFAIVTAFVTRQTAALYANNFGVLNNTVVIADAFSLFLEELLPLRNIVLDVQDPRTGAREAKPGDTITVKDWRTAVTAYQPSPGYAVPEGGDISIAAKDRQLTLPNTPWAVSFALTAAEYRLLASGEAGGAEYSTFRDRLMRQMVNGLGVKLMDLMFAVVTAQNFSTSFDSAVGTFGRSVEVDLDTKLFQRNVPTDGAMVIAAPALYGEWVKDHIAIQTSTAENRPKGLLVQGGSKSQNSNFEFWRTNRTMPAAAARGFALSRTAIIAAFRVPDEATYENDPVSLNTIIDPITGIPLLSRLWKNASTGAIQLDLASLPVFAKGQTEALERIVVPVVGS